MRDVMFIDADSVRKLGYVHKNVLLETITVTIKRVQIGMLRKLMGATSYDALADALAASLPPTVVIVPLTADQIDLIENYIQPYLVACVDYRIVFPLTFRSRSKSVGKGTDDNQVPADLAELAALKDQMRKDVDVYGEALLEKLEQNCDTSEKNTNTPWHAIKFR